MASLTVQNLNEQFPNGTAVSVYDRHGGTFVESQKGTARGNSPQTVTNGAVSFTGLDPEAPYWLAASVSGAWKSIAVTADESAETPIDTTGDLDIAGTLSVDGTTALNDDVSVDGDVAVTGGLGVNGSTPPAQAAAIATPASPGASYVQAEVVALRTAISSILVALRDTGIIDT